MTTTWRHFELGARVRKLVGNGEERIGLDRASGKPVTLRVYPHPRPGIALPTPLADRAQHLAQPLELVREEGEAIVARELAFGPSLENLLLLGPQPALVVSALLRQLLEGLARLHAEGRTHLRLSPAAIRFDLLAGLLKVTDLEQALLEVEPPDDLIPRYLEPEVRGGSGRPANDIYSVGRIGEALLRGGAPLGPWGGAGGVPGVLWDFVQRCQSPLAVERPPDATEALAQLDRLGLSQAPALTLPIGGFVRRHVRALRELRRWRAQPLPPLGPSRDNRGYRELLSSAQASRLWGAMGVAALLFVAATVAVAQSPRRGRQSSSGVLSDTCEPDARPLDLESGAPVPEGKVGIRLAGAEGQTVAIDGCLLRSEPGSPLLLAVSRGVHEFRGTSDAHSVARSLEVRDGDQISLATEKAGASGTADAVGALVQRLKQGPAPSEALAPLDPLESGLFDPVGREVLEAVRAVFDNHDDLSSELPASLGLTVDGLRAAKRRFDAAGATCAATLATAVAQEMGTGTDDSDRALQLAAELLTVTRIRGGELREPLRTEKQVLERLQVSPSRRLLSAVDQLAARADISRCLADLAPSATPVNELSVLAIGQLPGVRLPDEPAAGDDSTQ